MAIDTLSAALRQINRLWADDYWLTGMPKRESNQIVVMPDRDQSYVSTHKDIADSPGLDPVTADIELNRGVWIAGKIRDKVTGEPLRGRVEYLRSTTTRTCVTFPVLTVRSCSSPPASEQKRMARTESSTCLGPAWSPCIPQKPLPASPRTSFGGGLRTGETKDLGEVQMSVPKPDDPKPIEP